ncbi:MAG TPA: LarC family nickel insertion protein, partial [Terriglobia bacterium]|nr:LarC family nickel insertion protein [Terriglobia bacterium]
MKHAYLDCSSGISGDMLLGAMLDAGLALDGLLSQLKTIPLGDYEFKAARVMRAGLGGTHVEIIAPGRQPERHLADIERLILGSEISTTAKERALQIFGRIADAEGKLHSKPASKVHFHEVGAVDAILDVAGACVGFELLEVSELVASPLNLGGGDAQGGRIDAAHGSLPIPAPATAELLRGIPVYSSGLAAEMVTPTGAAIVATLAARFGPLPPMTVEQIGYGAGSRDLPGHPNLLRLFVGEPARLPATEPRIPAGGETSNSDDVVS